MNREDADLHVRTDRKLVEAARHRAGLPLWLPLPAVARFALARLAGYDHEEALQLARGRIEKRPQ
jgi:hypothetical protein